MQPPQRNLIICNEAVPNPVIGELEKLGFEIARDVWQPSEAQLQRLLLAWVYFYDCIKRPAKVRRLRRDLGGRAPLVAWNRDAPSYKGRSGWRVRLAAWRRPLDIYMSHSLADGLKFGQQQLYLPNAVDPQVYNLNGVTLAQLRQPERYQVDVSFFGGLDGENHAGQARRKQFLDALAQRLDRAGISHRFFDGKGMSVAEQIDLIQRSRINLQYGATCEYPGHLAGGLPERCFGVAACGGFLLADQRFHAADDFSLGENYLEFASLDDCERQIRHYLADFAANRALAEAAHRHVVDRHSYAQRAARVVEAARQWQQYAKGRRQ